MAADSIANPVSHFRISIDGITARFFKQVSGLGADREITKVYTTDAQGNPTLGLVAGNTTWKDVTIERVLDVNSSLFEWNDRTREKGEKNEKKPVMIEAIGNDNQVITTFSLKNACIKSYDGADFKAEGNEVGVEKCVLVHEGLERKKG